VKVVTVSSWLNFGRPCPGKGVWGRRKFLAPPYYSQHTVFASPLSAFSFAMQSWCLCMMSEWNIERLSESTWRITSSYNRIWREQQLKYSKVKVRNVTHLNVLHDTTVGLCLTDFSVFHAARKVLLDSSKISQRRTVTSYWSKIFYRLDAASNKEYHQLTVCINICSWSPAWYPAPGHLVGSGLKE